VRELSGRRVVPHPDRHFDYIGLLASVDELYRSVVSEPEAWSDTALADWAGDLAGASPIPKPVAKAVRQSLRAAQKLQAFWVDAAGAAATDTTPEDWRSRVDRALGPRAWRPTLDVARIGLADAPSPELFEEVRGRFRVVYSDRWMEGVTFEEWLEDARRSQARNPASL
jgi:hypothetical protein